MQLELRNDLAVTNINEEFAQMLSYDDVINDFAEGNVAVCLCRASCSCQNIPVLIILVLK